MQAQIHCEKDRQIYHHGGPDAHAAHPEELVILGLFLSEDPRVKDCVDHEKGDACCS